MDNLQPTATANPAGPAPKYEAYGINIEERGNTTHIFKDNQHIGSFSINLDARKLEFQFPGNEIFTYFAYIASDLTAKRVQWVNESLTNKALDTIQAGVAFLGFAKFEEYLAKELGSSYDEPIH